jgi:hypothetical protein
LRFFTAARGVAENVVGLDKHVADIDADAHLDRGVVRQLLLHLHRAADRGDDAGELHQRPIAHELHDATAVLGHTWLEHFGKQVLEARQRARFILLPPRPQTGSPPVCAAPCASGSHAG